MKPLNEVYIYALVDPREGTPRYIGQTDSPERRMLQHLSKTIDKNRDKHEWVQKTLTEGYRIYMMLLDRVPRTEGDKAEKEWIAHFAGLGVNLFNKHRK